MQAKTVCACYQKYLAENASASENYDSQNAVFRYLIPALGGPWPSVKKRAKLSGQDIEARLSFLTKTDAKKLTHVLEALPPANNTSQAQQERRRRNLRALHSRRLQP